MIPRRPTFSIATLGRVGLISWGFLTLFTNDPSWSSAIAQQNPPEQTKTISQAAAAQVKALPGFRVDLIYSVPEAEQGSWVNLAVDPKGRLITSDQYGGLYRVTLPSPQAGGIAVKVEPIAVEIGEAQGLLWAFDSLYVVVNKGAKYQSGLYRVRDTNGDDQLDNVELLRKLEGGGEHGPHAVLLTPDGTSLTIVCGNQTKLTALSGSRVPLNWGEDHLLPRLPDGRGFMVGVLAPGGCVYRVDPDGKNWELLSMGYRNQFDAAYNRAGDLFTYDADMEWDLNTPWYRPTRINLVSSGSDYGWRNGAGKRPPYYIDTLPSIVDIGPGSPTGVCFGYDARFPAKYREALFVCDWSYGKLYAVHLTPDGAAYTGQVEEFLSGQPLPLTDVVVNPVDGQMYFTVGGRRTTSGLYRVSYTGPDVATADASPASSRLRVVRLLLEQFHGRKDPQAVPTSWPYLSHADRFLRYAARVAIEHQDVSTWRDKALSEKEPQAAIEALLALVHCSAPDPFHRKPSDPPVDESLKAKIFSALLAIPWESLTERARVDLLRVYEVSLNRLGRPDEATVQKLIARFDAVYPTPIREQNASLCQLLVYLQAPNTASKTINLLIHAPTQEEQIEYARSLRMLKTGWSPELRRQYFSWFAKASTFKGGASLEGFLAQIKRDAVETLTPEEKQDLASLLEAKPNSSTLLPDSPSRPLVKEWSLEDLAQDLDAGVSSGRDFERGRSLFGVAQCFACHRFATEGGAVGPDLTGVAGRFTPRDLLESILSPSKTISDQYQAVTIATTDGKVVTGRIVNLSNDNLMVMTNMLDPGKLDTIKRGNVEEMQPSSVSMMPNGLLNTLQKEEILDLMAYLLSGGDRSSPRFAKPSGVGASGRD